MGKISVTQEQRDNLLEALNVMWPSVPQENVIPSLETWRYGYLKEQPPDCGTVACFGGWCAWWPAFRAKGVTAAINGAPRLGVLEGSGVASRLFGWGSVFYGRHLIDADRGFKGTDHELVTHRLKWLLKNSEVVA